MSTTHRQNCLNHKCDATNFLDLGIYRMKQSIVHIALVVRDYDEALDFYINKLKFELIEDTYQPEQDKRWVVVSPPGSQGATLLLAKASKPEQLSYIGNQSGGRAEEVPEADAAEEAAARASEEAVVASRAVFWATPSDRKRSMAGEWMLRMGLAFFS